MPVATRIIIALLVSHFAIMPVEAVQQEPPPETPRHTSQLNLQWLDSVVSIERRMTNSATGKSDWAPIGTGFLVKTDLNHIVLITAKHVVFDSAGSLYSELGYRLTDKGKDTLITEVVLKASEPRGWFPSPTADVALRFFGTPPGTYYRDIPQSAFVDTSSLEPGAPLVVLGFPLGLRSQVLSRAIARRGMLAGIEKGLLIIDAFVFPGNSGGPVIYLPAFRLDTSIIAAESPLIGEEKLIGLVVDYITYQDVAVSAQTNRSRIIFEENSGLAHVVPIDIVKELLRDAAVKAADQALPNSIP